MNYPIRFAPLKLPLLLRIFVFSALFPWLGACQTPAPNNTYTPEVTITPEATDTPEITGNLALEGLLAYLPSSWVGRHLPVAWGPAIHFVDVAQIRHDLELADFRGADTFAEKQTLILQVHNQGLAYLPASLHIVGSNSFATLGWDIADVAQVLYLPDADTAILRGDFARSAIQTALQANGTGTAYRAFTFYPAGSDGLYMAWKADTMIVSGLADGEYIVKALIDNQAYPGLAVQTKIQALLPHMAGAWGAVLAPSPDTATFSAQNMSNLSSEMQDQLEERFGSLVMPPLAWDFMAMQHRWDGDTTQLVLVYNYPTADVAAANRNTVLISLTETPSTQAANQTWADLLTVDRVMTVDNQVIVQAHTEATNFIGNAFHQRDFTGFLALPIDGPKE